MLRGMVRILQTLNIFFEKKLRALIEDELRNKKENLSRGSVNDFASYYNQVGVMNGLRIALDLCEDAQKACEER